MGLINLPYTFSPNTTISSSQMNSNFTTVVNEFNGNIAAANLASNAVTTAKIADSNVTTAKIADSNITTAKINAGAVTPSERSGGFFIGQIPAATMSTTGNKAVTGVGFTPKLVTFTTGVAASNSISSGSTGAMTTLGQYYLAWASDTASTTTFARNSSNAACIGFVQGGSSTPTLLATYVSMDSDGFTINVGTAVSLAVNFIAFG